MSDNWDHLQAGLYTDGGVIDEFELVSGSFIIPLAENAPSNNTELAEWSPVAVVQAHAPYRIKRVHFKSKKSGSPPEMPKPASTGALVFIGGMLAFQQPQVDSTLTNFNWQGLGQYEFVEDCRSDVADGFVLTGRPFTLPAQVSAQLSVGASQPQYGAVAQAGPDARTGYTIGQQMSLTDPTYTYTIPTFVPAIFFNSLMLNGYAPVQSISGDL